MSANHKWQTFNGIIQNFLLFATILVAAKVGFKQVEISARQTEISERLLDLEYAISVAVVWQSPKFIILNFSRTNVAFGGFQILEAPPPALLNPPRLIPPGGQHYLNMKPEFEKGVREKITKAPGTVNVPIDFYFVDARQTKFVLHTNLACELDSGSQLTIAIQPGLPEKRDW